MQLLTGERSDALALDRIAVPEWAAGRYLYAATIAVFGAVWLLSGGFVSIWQPLPDVVPAPRGIAYLSGLAFLLSAAALLYPPTARYGAIAPILVFPLFVWQWTTRIILLPAVAGTWSGTAEEVVPIVAAMLILPTDGGSKAAPSWLLMTCRILFGLCAVSFGIVHFEALQQTADMVPAWLPGSGSFWAKATGIAHAVGGLALILNFKPRWAAGLLAVMYLLFDLLIWLPKLVTAPADPIVWAGNAMTVILAASALVLAGTIAANETKLTAEAAD
jgi:uncharacterized membrane protein YphA (DoxX/SURF4 family)